MFKVKLFLHYIFIGFNHKASSWSSTTTKSSSGHSWGDVIVGFFFIFFAFPILWYNERRLIIVLFLNFG